MDLIKLLDERLKKQKEQYKDLLKNDRDKKKVSTKKLSKSQRINKI